MAHPWTVELTQVAPPLTPNALAWMEAGLEAFADAPLTSQQRLSAMLAIDVWSQNHVRQSNQMGLVGHPEPDSPQANYLAIIGQRQTIANFALGGSLGLAGHETLNHWLQQHAPRDVQQHHHTPYEDAILRIPAINQAIGPQKRQPH